ncbi:MAG: thioesterase family protein [Actinomycetota bacterium]|nr:thioesterase family protein [Actinomycetota bacterium]
MTSFEDTTSIRRTDDGVFEADLDDRWWVVRGPHGGYLASIVLRALLETQPDPDRHIRSLTTHYLAAPKAGPMRIHASVQRTGRSMTYASARAVQDDRPVAMALAAFSVAWPGLEFNDNPMPDVVGPEEGFPVPTEGDGIPRFLGNFDMRWVLGEQPFSGAEHALVGGWYRLREPVLADAVVAATLLDAWPPAVFPKATQLVVAPTVDLTMHFRTALPLEGAQPDDFYLGRFLSRASRDGFFEEDGELWSKDGQLIAQSRQLALALMPGR